MHWSAAWSSLLPLVMSNLNTSFMDLLSLFYFYEGHRSLSLSLPSTRLGSEKFLVTFNFFLLILLLVTYHLQEKSRLVLPVYAIANLRIGCELDLIWHHMLTKAYPWPPILWLQGKAMLGHKCLSILLSRMHGFI